MCGIASVFAYDDDAPGPEADEVHRLCIRMAGRGPDGAGAWFDDDRRIGLGHRRLSIIDLCDRAAQPMVSACGHYVISFNGEIYNYQELRDELVARGCRFRTTSDTEVLLELFRRDGEAAFSQLRGMFALALWDQFERVLWLARDPYGIKPLYYTDDGHTVRAASQVKALLAGGGVSGAPEPAGIVGFFLFGSVPDPFTCFRDIRAVPAGSVVRVDAHGACTPETYASIGAAFREAERSGPAGRDAREEVRAALLDSVRHHLVADVPVGVFLSSGIDSAVLLALMAEIRSGAGADPIRAVTVAFSEYRGGPDDEVPLAADLAVRFGAEHTVRVVDEKEFAADFPRIVDAMDQPTIDGVNTWFVSKAARERGLKVAVSGLGGDELFGGYPSFHDLPRWVSLLGIPSHVPLAGRVVRALVASLGSARGWHPKLAGMVELGGTWPGAYLLRRGVFMPWELEAILELDVLRTGLHRLRWDERIAAMLAEGPTTPLTRVGMLEASLYMRHQLLRDTDWSSMAHSLEVRVPLVDIKLLHSVAPFSLRYPLCGKRLLAGSTAAPLPEAVLQRPKTGFSTPVERWVQRAPEVISSRPEPWARRWAQIIAKRMLPEDALNDRSRASSGASALTGGVLAQETCRDSYR